MAAPLTIVWFDNDLRLADHAPLTAAAQRGQVLPVYVHAPDEAGDWPAGEASDWFRHHALDNLARTLRDAGSRLIIRSGPSLETLLDLCESTGADAVYWHTRYEPALAARDQEIADALDEAGIGTQAFPGYLLHEPGTVRTGGGGLYRVFTPFWRKLKATLDVGDPLPVPELAGKTPDLGDLDSLPLDDLALLPDIGWDAQFYDTWTPSEDSARARLDALVDDALLEYPENRNRLDLDGTSMLSPHLHHGTISPRQVLAAADAWVKNGVMRDAADKFLSELAWRDFAYVTLQANPDLPTRPIQDKFDAFPWRDSDDLETWQRGRTGYPVVDAGMRQLWAIGWMHNRARLLTASFMVKHLLLPWQEGERWFWDTLCGADLGNNAMNWQWVAGSGVDASPFFRIFNPIAQGKRFDPKGDYVRRWVPELADLPTKFIHAPWTAPADVLKKAGVELGATYPEPIVQHDEARERAMEAFQSLG